MEHGFPSYGSILKPQPLEFTGAKEHIGMLALIGMGWSLISIRCIAPLNPFEAPASLWTSCHALRAFVIEILWDTNKIDVVITVKSLCTGAVPDWVPLVEGQIGRRSLSCCPLVNCLLFRFCVCEPSAIRLMWWCPLNWNGIVKPTLRSQIRVFVGIYKHTQWMHSTKVLTVKKARYFELPPTFFI